MSSIDLYWQEYIVNYIWFIICDLTTRSRGRGVTALDSKSKGTRFEHRSSRVYLFVNLTNVLESTRLLRM